MPYISSYYGQRHANYQGYGEGEKTTLVVGGVEYADVEEYLGHPVTADDLCAWYEYANPFSDYPCTAVSAAYNAKLAARVAAKGTLEDPGVIKSTQTFINAVTGEIEQKAKGIITDVEKRAAAQVADVEQKAEAFRRKALVGSAIVGVLLLGAGKFF